MWKIYYDYNEKLISEPREILEFIKGLHLEYQNKQAQFLAIELQGIGYVEIGIGDKLNRSMIFYSPIADEEDKKISYTPKGDKTKKVKVFSSKGVLRDISEYNLIRFDAVLGEVEYFLYNKNISNNIKWYSV